MKGLVMYSGPSMLTRQPIVAVLTGLGRPSLNPKTGPMLQLWVLPRDVDPLTAVRTGADRAVCGNCKHRGTSCYVRVQQAPLSVWRAYQRGTYTPWNPEHADRVRGRAVRLGAYGDPAALPVAVARMLAELSGRTTGYTHQWRSRVCMRTWLMASVDTPEERTEAMEAGWRTFRVRHTTNDPLLAGEFVCPASPEGGTRMTCDRCNACHGAGHGHSPAIVIHGSVAKVAAFHRTLSLIQRTDP